MSVGEGFKVEFLVNAQTSKLIVSVLGGCLCMLWKFRKEYWIYERVER